MGTADRDDERRAEVRRLKTRSGRHRTLTRLLHVGSLGGARLVVPVRLGERAPDQGLATDLLTRALDRLGRPEGQQVWLTRSGRLVAGDDDWCWRRGTTLARARYGLDAGDFLVVTRHGWLSLPSGEQRSWRRMRASWVAPYDDDRPDPVGPDPVDGWPISF